jgi:hypothetical protein
MMEERGQFVGVKAPAVERRSGGTERQRNTGTKTKWCENNPQSRKGRLAADTLRWNGGFGRNDMWSFLQSILKTKCTFLQIFVSFYEKIRKNAQKYEKNLIFGIPKSRCKRL